MTGEYIPTPQVLAIIEQMRSLERRLESLRSLSSIAMRVSLAAPLAAFACLFTAAAWPVWLVVFCAVLSVGVSHVAHRQVMLTLRKLNELSERLLELVPRSAIGAVYLQVRGLK